MLKTKSGEQLKELTTNQFAEEILDNPNKVFCFLTEPKDDYCYFLASVNLFGSQTVVINGGRFIGDCSINVPGMTHAFSMFCYDASWELCYDREDCLNDIVNGLTCFDGTQGKHNKAWYIVDDGKVNTLEVICH